MLAGGRTRHDAGDAFAPIHEPRVEPERDVVQEDPAVHPARVDAGFPAREGIEGGNRIIAVEPEVTREVVSCTERDDDNGTSRSRATSATGPSEPSPPAIPSACALAALATSAGSSPGERRCVSRLRRCASSRSASGLGSASPARGLITSRPPIALASPKRRRPRRRSRHGLQTASQAMPQPRKELRWS